MECSSTPEPAFDADVFFQDFVGCLKRLASSDGADAQAEREFDERINAAYERLAEPEMVRRITTARMTLGRAIRRVMIAHRHLVTGKARQTWTLNDTVSCASGDGVVQGIIGTAIGQFYQVCLNEDGDVVEIFAGLDGEQDVADT